MFQKALVAVFVLAITYAMVSPLVERVAQSMDNSANMIAEASAGRVPGAN